MNIPTIILNDRKIISSDVFHYYQSLALRLIMKKKNSNVNIKPNYSKEKIQNWFSNLSLKEKYKICSIYNSWFSNIIFQLLEYSCFESVIEFCPTDVYREFKKNNLDEITYLKHELNEISKNEKIKNYEHFMTFFTAENNVKKLTGIPEDYELLNINKKFHMEKLFLAELRFISLDEFNDTISFSKDLFNHPERIFEFLNYFSKNQCFNSIINPIQEKNNNYNFSFPKWIYNYKTYSLYQILVIFFEQIISVYYQLYLYEKVLPQFNIEQKFSEFFKNNENLKNYLSKKIKNITDDFIVDRQKCLELINSESLKSKYEYFENKTKNIYSFAFGTSLYDQKIDTKREFNLKFYYLMEFAKKNSNDFIDKISFIEAKDSFKFLNFIYFAIYQQLIEQCSEECYQELLIEENNKTNNQQLSSKQKKNKKKKKKKKKQGIKEIKNENNNINVDFKDNEEEKINNIEENNEEEIEEIPSDYIVHPKTEQNLKDLEFNNNIINNNDINNSTVSSSYTNKYSKDYSNVSLGPKYNNFFKCEKKESEMLLEIKDFSDDKSEESDLEKDKNNKFELEDISEHDISEENINIEDGNNIQINLEDNKKKKKKHKKRNKKKKNKFFNENLDENIIQINNENSSEKKLKNRDKNINEDKKIKHQKIEINNEDITKKDIEDTKKNNINIQNIPPIFEEKHENNSMNEKIKESQKESKEKFKRKNNKDFFLYPVNINKKKENNLNNKRKEKMESNIIINFKNTSNESLNNIISKGVKKINIKNESFEKKINLKSSIKKEIPERISIKNLEINTVANITINSYNKEKKEINENEDKFLNEDKKLEFIKKEDNLLFLNQQPFPNSFFYENGNNTFLVIQNELFSNLGKDILEFQKSVESNLRDIKKYREQIINKFKEFILNILQKNYFIKFLFYGSYSTGLSIESSDIDILLKFSIKEKGKEGEINYKKNIHDLIFLLNEEFKKQMDELKIIKINPIYTASIPVLKVECLLKDIIPLEIQKKLSKNYLFDFQNELLKLNFDFTFLEVDDINKEISIPSHEIIHFIKESIKAYPIIKPIILVLKRYMQIHELNSSYQGGISSFSLFLLLASYNKQIFYENKYFKMIEDFENLLGQLFYGFFLFYSNFNFRINCIDLRQDNPIYLINEFNENKITIIDPITGLNAAKSTFRIEDIKSTFNNAIMAINEIFYKSINYIDNNKENNILKKLFSTHNNFTDYFY